MILPATQRQAYASAPSGGYLREGVILTHPVFTRRWTFTPQRVAFSALDPDGATVTFDRATMAVVPPGQDKSGLGRMPIRFAAIPEAVRELMAASAQSNVPVRLVSLIYQPTETTAQMTIAVDLTGIEIDPDTGIISGVAGLADVEGRAFPGRVYRVAQFPGLARK